MFMLVTKSVVYHKKTDIHIRQFAVECLQGVAFRGQDRLFLLRWSRLGERVL